MSSTASDARERLRQLQSSWDYAFATGHSCSTGVDPSFDAIRREVADLNAIIAERELGEAD